MELTRSLGGLRVEPSPTVHRWVLDRPGQGNSLTDELLEELHQALDAAEDSRSCRMVVLEGREGQFSTGMDLGRAAVLPRGSGAPSPAGTGGRFLELLKRFASSPLVVVAKVDGRVSGGGVGLVAASDFSIATERSRFSLPEALWGLLPCCVLPFLVRRIGFQKAYTMTLSTLPVTAREALRYHLVDEVHEDAETPIRRLVFRLEKLDRRTVPEVKSYFRRLWNLSPEVEKAALSELSRLMSSGLAQQRITDFLTGRRLPWEG